MFNALSLDVASGYLFNHSFESLHKENYSIQFTVSSLLLHVILCEASSKSLHKVNRLETVCFLQNYAVEHFVSPRRLVSREANCSTQKMVKDVLRAFWVMVQSSIFCRLVKGLPEFITDVNPSLKGYHTLFHVCLPFCTPFTIYSHFDTL